MVRLPNRQFFDQRPNDVEVINNSMYGHRMSFNYGQTLTVCQAIK